MRLIDTHCHPQMAKYDADQDAVIKRSLEADIGLIAIGTTIEDSLQGIKLAEQYPDDPVFAAVGIHPTDEDIEGIHPAQLAGLLGSKKIVAIGETGLDYFHETDPDKQGLQADIFEQHILLAAQSNLPLIVHCRDKNDVFGAYDDVYALLNRHRVSRFVMHCFSGDWAQAEKFLDLGGYLSFTGIITFPKSAAMHEVIKKMPLEKMMLETDAPFLAPVPHRGERNEPAYVEFVAKKVAELRGVGEHDTAKTTTENAIRLFGLSSR